MNNVFIALNESSYQGVRGESGNAGSYILPPPHVLVACVLLLPYLIPPFARTSLD